MREAFICDAVRTPIGRYVPATRKVLAITGHAPCTMCIGVGQGIAIAIERV